MADNTPAAPQARKQIMDEHGNFVPVPIEDQPRNPTDPASEPRGFKIGDAVTLAGRVLEVQSPQGGQTSVKVQTTAGAEWFRGEHITVVDKAEAARVTGLEKQASADAARIADLEKQVAALQKQIADAKAAADKAKADAEATAATDKAKADAGKPVAGTPPATR